MTDTDKLNYPGELTSEALATLDIYIKQCCNVSATAKKLNKGYIKCRQYLKQPYVRDLFQLYLLRKGITPEKIAQGILDGLSASNNVYHLGKRVDETPDWHARHRFTQLACEVFEVLKYQAKVEMNDNSSNTFLIQKFSNLSVEQLKEKAGELISRT